MTRAILTTIAAIFIFTTAQCQITKGNWLFGGNISFSSSKSSGDLGTITDNTIEAAGNAGYFFIDKLAAGIKPNVYFYTEKFNTVKNGETTSIIGPFLRYYFLPTDNKTNLFAECSYGYGISKVKNQNATHSHSFTFMAGPVFFLNPSVGLELSVGYTTRSFNYNANSRLGVLKAIIGLQFHLEKQ